MRTRADAGLPAGPARPARAWRALRAGLAGLCLAFAGAASAQDISARTPDVLVAWLESEGLPVRAGIDPVGDPMIEVRYFGTSYIIYFYDCIEGADCRSLQFYSAYRVTRPVSPGLLNAWNAERRYSKTYVAQNGDVRLELDVHTGLEGIAAGDFETILELWHRSLVDFEEALAP
jgi:hypothetical protein